MKHRIQHMGEEHDFDGSICVKHMTMFIHHLTLEHRWHIHVQDMTETTMKDIIIDKCRVPPQGYARPLEY